MQRSTMVINGELVNHPKTGLILISPSKKHTIWVYPPCWTNPTRGVSLQLLVSQATRPGWRRACHASTSALSLGVGDAQDFGPRRWFLQEDLSNHDIREKWCVYQVVWTIYFIENDACSCTLSWVNYNDLTTTSLESWLVRGIIPK